MKKKGFTLLELLIVMVLLGLLFVMLLRTYNWISVIVFRVQQEKEVNQEILQLSQIVQNFADRNSINFENYKMQDSGSKMQDGSLITTQGLTDELYLSGQDGQVKLYSSGDCKDPAEAYPLTGLSQECVLYVSYQGKNVALTNPKKITMTKTIFKIIPFASEQEYLSGEGLCAPGDYLHCIHSPGFRMIFSAYSINYGKQRATRVHVPFQQFY